MEIQQITPKIEKTDKHSLSHSKKAQNPTFTSAGTALYAVPAVFLRFLDTNQAWGANLVDLGSMVIPRTAYDMKNRGAATGFETLRRESTGTANHASVGLYGTFFGALFAAMSINSKYGIKAHKIFANNDTISILGNKWYDAVHATNSADYLQQYLDDVVSSIKVYNPSAAGENIDGLVDIDKNTQDLVVRRFKELIQNTNAKDTIQDKDIDYIKRLITAATGGEKNVVLKGNNIQVDNTLSTLIGNIHNLTKTFIKEKVLDDFKNVASFDEVKIMKSLKSLNIKRSIGGLGLAAAIGMSVQPINMYLTKKKTGIDGFPGVPGRKKDKSTSFKILKTVMAILFGTGAISTIMIGDKKSAAKELSRTLTSSEKFKNFINRFLAKIQFKGKMPTINQLKFVYGMTIVSRLLSARDKDELRESTVKDTLGFLNLLVLGALVTKGATRLFNKNLINLPKGTGKGFFNWMRNSSVKTRDEVLLETLGKHGIAVTENGKAMSYGKLLKQIKNLPEDVRSDLWKKLGTLDIAQLIGYAYSGIFLGYYLPKINATMSARNEEKRLQRVAKEEGKTVEQIKAEMAEELKRLEAKAQGKEYIPEKEAVTVPINKPNMVKEELNSFTAKYMKQSA